MTRPRPPLLPALAVLAVGSVLGGVLFGVVYSPTDGLLMGVFMLACGVPVIAATHLLVARRRRSESLGRQFTSAVTITVGLVTLGVGVVALLMFISGHDALVMAVLLVLAGGLTAYSSWLLSRDVIAERDAAEAARRGLVAAARTTCAHRSPRCGCSRRRSRTSSWTATRGGATSSRCPFTSARSRP